MPASSMRVPAASLLLTARRTASVKLTPGGSGGMGILVVARPAGRSPESPPLAPPAPVASPMEITGPMRLSTIPAANRSPDEYVFASTTTTTGPHYGCPMSLQGSLGDLGG